jgi:hypothetical protein
MPTTSKFRKYPDQKDEQIKALALRIRELKDLLELEFAKETALIEARNITKLSLHQMDTINREIRIENDRLRMMMRGAMRIMRYRKEQNQKLRRELNRVR